MILPEPTIISKLLHPRSSAPLLPALLCAGLALSGIVRAQPATAPATRKLVVISIAGLDARFLTDPGLHVKAPHIRKLMREGASASGVAGVAPSETWPSEVSLVTGVIPSRQSAVATPIWEPAARNGLKTAVVCWPGTARTEIGFDFPPLRGMTPGQDVAFDEIARQSSPPGVVDRIENSSPGFAKQLWDDTSAARAAIYLLDNEKPDLLLVQFMDLDSEQRETGALSVYARDTLENDDDLVGQILAALPRGAVVALVSGHGFENENYLVRPRVLLKPASGPGQANVEVEDGLIGTTDPATAARLRKLMTDGRRHGIAREVPMAEVRAKAPPLGRWVAAFDTLPNYVASADDRGPALGRGTHLGVSGLWPSRPGYRSVFAIWGEDIPARSLGEIDLLQIAPTLADALGVEIPMAKRKSLLAPAISR